MAGHTVSHAWRSFDCLYMYSVYCTRAFIVAGKLQFFTFNDWQSHADCLTVLPRRNEQVARQLCYYLTARQFCELQMLIPEDCRFTAQVEP